MCFTIWVIGTILCYLCAFVGISCGIVGSDHAEAKKKNPGTLFFPEFIRRVGIAFLGPVLLFLSWVWGAELPDESTWRETFYLALFGMWGIPLYLRIYRIEVKHS
jgi:hypothetical protein